MSEEPQDRNEQEQEKDLETRVERIEDLEPAEGEAQNVQGGVCMRSASHA